MTMRHASHWRQHPHQRRLYAQKPNRGPPWIKSHVWLPAYCPQFNPPSGRANGTSHQRRSSINFFAPFFANKLMAFRTPSKPSNGFAVQIRTGPPTLSVYTSAPSTTPHPMQMAWHGAKNDHVQHRKLHASWSMHPLQATTLLQPMACPRLP